jgi:hypothetical protein
MGTVAKPETINKDERARESQFSLSGPRANPIRLPIDRSGTEDETPPSDWGR